MTIPTFTLLDNKLKKFVNKPVEDGSKLLEGDQPQVDSKKYRVFYLLRKVDPRSQRKNGSVMAAFLLSAALFVLASGVFGGLYIYQQFTNQKLPHFRAWCSIPLTETGRFIVDRPLHSIESENAFQAGKLTSEDSKILYQGLDLDIERDDYESIEVPYFSDIRRARFIHDFSANKTAIIDLDSLRCFILPLDRSAVLPPKSLLDMVMKMRSGYYDVDTKVVRNSYRVVQPPLTDLTDLGQFISRDCSDMRTYLLRKVDPESRIFNKRDTNENKPAKFLYYGGSSLNEFDIVNLQDGQN